MSSYTYNTLEESPRMVTAADRWECDVQDSPTFPTGKRPAKVTPPTMAKPIPFLGERLEKRETSFRIRPKTTSRGENPNNFIVIVLGLF